MCKKIIELYPRTSYVYELVVVDGIMRTGKFLHDALVSSLERCEMWQQYPVIDSIPYLHRLGHISTSAAVNLLRREIDMHLYYGMLGRRSNFRRADRSSIWKYRTPQTYIDRSETKDEQALLSQIVNKEVNPIFCLSTHDVFCNPDVFFEAFPYVRVIYARRNPIDIVYSWHKKDWGRRIGYEERSLWLAFEGEEGPIPWFAADWKKLYESLSPMDKIIYGVDWQTKEAMNNYLNLDKSQREQVFMASFEWVATDPDNYLDLLCLHVNSERSSHTSRIMKEENVPRVLKQNDLNMRINEIRKNASAKSFKHLMLMQEKYHEESEQYFKLDTLSMRNS